MENIKNQAADIVRMTSGSEHSFFGYYDLMAWDAEGRYHLCHKVKFADRLPEKEDIAQLGTVDIHGRGFTPLAETTAWNFQQGSMLQWNPGAPKDEIVFNIRRGEEYRGVVKNIYSGEERILDMPVANLDPTGKYGLSINFDRMFDFRPGYGYAGRKDRFFSENAPSEDGIFLVDMETGKSRLIISLYRIWEFLKDHDSGVQYGKLLINHINFNTDGTRFVFLARNFPQKGKTWETAVCTANADGSGLFLLSDYRYASHYYWKDPRHLLVHARHVRGEHLYLMEDQTDSVDIIGEDYFLKDGHCSYSPDREWLLYDSYPDSQGYRHLYLYHVGKGKGITLASLYAYPVSVVDIRCDLHPRWHPAGKAITFDSIHENHRHMYYMDLEEIMKKEFQTGAFS